MTRLWIFLLLAAAAARGEERDLDVHRWKVIERESGPVSYYSVVDDPDGAFIHAAYRVGLKSVVLGVEVADADRRAARKLRWKWRALTLPQGSDPCVRGKGDAAAAVYVSWKRGVRWYTLKYVFGVGAPEGAVCHRKRSPFAAQDTIVLRSGGPLGAWVDQEIDLADEFRNHFEDGDPRAAVPDLAGIGILTDGDQTRSESVADYAGFVLIR
jgi:hypothetical protein